MKYESVKLLNNEGKMWHIGLDENDAGKHFILPGDPDRYYSLDSRLLPVQQPDC